MVLGSGNLGLVYVRGARRWTLQALEQEWPALVPGLAGHPGVGFVAGIDEEGRAWAIGSGGRRNIASGDVEGTDPLAASGPTPRGCCCVPCGTPRRRIFTSTARSIR